MSKEKPVRSDHPLFAKYPLDGTVEVDGEQLSTPYHIYNGEILLLGGTADSTVAAGLLRDERLTPILDTDGNALMAMWVCDFTEANLGPHHELQISLFASTKLLPPVPRHPFAIYRLLALNPAAYMVCHGLWNNVERVVRYNQVHLGLDAHLSASRFDRAKTNQQWGFQVDDAESGRPVAEGMLATPTRQPAAAMWSMLRHLGVQGAMQGARTQFVHVPVVNTRSAFAGDNSVAHTYTRSDRQIIRRYEDADQIVIRHQQYANLSFRPDFVQQSVGVRFVYLRPLPLPE